MAGSPFFRLTIKAHRVGLRELGPIGARVEVLFAHRQLFNLTLNFYCLVEETRIAVTARHPRSTVTLLGAALALSSPS